MKVEVLVTELDGYVPVFEYVYVTASMACLEAVCFEAELLLFAYETSVEVSDMIE